MLSYLDVAPVIYFIEQVPQSFAAVAARFATPGAVLIARRLTQLECLIDPLRKGDVALLQEYAHFFKLCRAARLTNTVYDRAASIRALNPSIQTPDAIHLAAAIESACDVFLTNDHRLTRFTGITVEVV
jgi:predicted nucleic acid-binding protein